MVWGFSVAATTALVTRSTIRRIAARTGTTSYACRSLGSTVVGSSSSNNNNSNNNNSRQHSTTSSTPIRSSDPPKNSSIVLYQYSICPFCHRVRSVLDYAQLPYVVKEVNPLTKAEIRPYRDRHKQVPIAEIDGTPVFGSDQIIQHLLLSSAANDKNNDILQSLRLLDGRDDDAAVEVVVEAKDPWVDFAVKKLAVLLYPNMCRTVGDSFRAIAYVHHIEPAKSSFSLVQRMLIQSIGSLAMYFAASRVKKKHNITDERQALQDTLQVLEDHLRGDGGEGNSDRLFLSSSSSSRPGLGDLAVYGTLRALEGLPLHAAILAGTTTAKTTTTTGDETPPVAVLGSWYERMQRLTPSAAIIRH